MSPRNAAKGVKARRMWAVEGTPGIIGVYRTKACAKFFSKFMGKTVRQVLVVPASPSDVAAWREKAAKAIYDCPELGPYAKADAVLAALGLTARTAQGRLK